MQASTLVVRLLLAVQSNRLGNDISFSDAGGVEIEENWDRVKKVTLDTEQPADARTLAPLLSTLPLELRPDMESFIQACYEVSQRSGLTCMSPAFLTRPHGMLTATILHLREHVPLPLLPPFASVIIPLTLQSCAVHPTLVWWGKAH